MQKVIRLAVVMLLLAAARAEAQWDGWDYTFDQEIKSWSEMQAQLPPYPRDPDLIPLDVSAVTTHRFFVDAASVSAGSDGVVRYTLVVKASGGATNVSFEGIRCESREQKYYAIGRVDKTWARARKPQWRPIGYQAANAQHLTLHGTFLCRGKLMVESAQQMIEALRRGHPRPDGSS